MKKLIITLAALAVTVPAYGQGAVTFNNRVTGVVDARVTEFTGGPGVGAGFTAQLYGAGGAGLTADKLVALTPTTTFRTSSDAAKGYVNPVDVIFSAPNPVVAAGAQATLQMRAFDGATFSASGKAGQSGVITIGLGGGTLPPANLVGLQGFSVPEPSTIALGVLGAALLFLRRRK